MNNAPRPGEIHLTPSEYDALYAGARLPGLDLDVPTWDVEGPRDAVMRWHAKSLIAGKILDAGCGTGSNALWLTSQGYEVTGFDGAPHALAIARSRIEAARQKAEFVETDATNMNLPDSTYDTVIDSALYHCLDARERHAYLSELHRVCRPRARSLMVCVSDAHPPSLPGPFRITREELLTVLPAHHWDIRDVRPGMMTVANTLELLRKVSAALGLPEPDGTEVEFTPDGYAQLATWEVVAEHEEDD